MKITLCGSARFENSFHHWNKYFTLRGHLVYSLAVFPSYTGKKTWYTDEQKERLDLCHLIKIQNSDSIFVITQGHINDHGIQRDNAYVGESTLREITYARFMGKKILFDYSETWVPKREND